MANKSHNTLLIRIYDLAPCGERKVRTVIHFQKQTSAFQYVRFPFRNSPVLSCAMATFRLGKALLSTAQITILALFVDEAARVLASGTVSAQLLWKAGLLAGVIAVDRLLDISIRVAAVSFRIDVDSAYERYLLDKQKSISYPVLEQSKTGELAERAANGRSGQMTAGFFNILDLAECLVRAAGIVFAAMSCSVWTGFVVLIMFLIVIPIAKKCGEANYEAYEHAAQKYRRANYIRSILSSREYVGERTLYGYTEPVNQIWEEDQQAGRILMQKANRRSGGRTKAAATAIILISMLLAVLLLFPVRSGAVTVGMYISIVTATTQLLAMLTWNLSSYLEEYAEYKCYLKDLEQFLSLPEDAPSAQSLDTQKPAWTHVETIEFRHVSFHYPGQDTWVLRDVSFTLERGKTYGFVGLNGAGKTTIIKLLTGLYRDHGGTILVNGRDINTLCEEARRELFGVVYQDYARYQISVWENLTIGCAEKPSAEEVSKVLEEVELKERIDRLSGGLAAELGQLEETGIDFSGGEWQKIAVARAILQHAPVRILDEPTASLDPIHERDLYGLFSRVQGSDIQLLISHRLGGVKNMDCILVLGEGRILEQGSHQELMAQKGQYAEMYESQRRWYQ